MLPQDIALVVEDQLSLAVCERLIAEVAPALQVSQRLVMRGAGQIRKSLLRFRQASHVMPHLVLTDLDTLACAPTLLQGWGALDLPASLLLRVAVREVEAWVLADRQAFADFASIPVTKISAEPESLPDPKQVLVNLVRQSKSRRLRAELVPEQGTALSIGPLYNERLGQFVQTTWNPARAAEQAPSLQRTRHRLSALASGCNV
jgi:hypothetical protein